MPMPKPVLAKYPNDVFVETGTYQGECVALAKELGFAEIHTMDCRPGYKAEGASFTCGDSPIILADLLPRLNGNITFWLDAHPLVTPMPLYSETFPLLREMVAIRRHLKPGRHVLLADDLRTFSERDLSDLFAVVGAFWPNAKVSREDNHIATGDILVVDMR